MNKFSKFVTIAIACFCLCACSKSDKNDDLINDGASKIIGRWYVTAWQDGLIYYPATDPEYYDFALDGEFKYVYEYTPDLKSEKTGTYTYNNLLDRIHVDATQGWDLNIWVEYTNPNEAIFKVYGTSSKTVKVKKQ